MPELGSLGSVRGALRNGRPYRECENSAAHQARPEFRSPERAKQKKSRNFALRAALQNVATSFRTVCLSYAPAVVTLWVHLSV